LKGKAEQQHQSHDN